MANVLQAAPSPRTIREELRQAVLKDLLGPAAGPEEEVDEKSVRERYLVGGLAPRQQSPEPEASAPEDNTGFRLRCKTNSPSPENLKLKTASQTRCHCLPGCCSLHPLA
jgi:hypothetical protein